MRCSGRCSPGSVSTRIANSSATKRRRRNHANDGAITEIPAGLLPERPKPAQQPPDDPALQEYNAYLAELAKKDAEKQNRTTA